jgi:diguanylate cyclase (GGDEF)-like protein
MANNLLAESNKTVIATITGALRAHDSQALARRLGEYASVAAEDDALRMLSAALDEIGDGIILLNRDLRMEFANRAAYIFGGGRRPAPGEKPTYVEMIRGARVATSREGLDEYIARRLETVRSGDPTPVEVRFLDGRIVHAKCTVLPDGGRLLHYSDVTDVLRHKEELQTLHAAIDQIATGVILLDAGLRAQFINRAFRKMSDMPGEFAAAKPAFQEILEHGRRTNAFGVPASELDEYIAGRLKMVEEGDPRPVELNWSAGRVVRYQIARLPGGGRMLTYADISDLAHTAEQLEKLAMTDGLTGLFNRRHYMTLAGHEWNRYRRYDRPFSILLLDIDYFKAVNDRYGHDVGDQMIVHISNMCLESKRGADVAARVGGEEFALLLPETDLKSACHVAERLRETVAGRPLATGSAIIPVTVSIGVAEVNDQMTGVFDLMKLADRMLYAAKRGGRNRIASPAPGEMEATQQPPLVLAWDN